MMAAGFLKEYGDYNGLICPMIDARRMEVFTAVYDNSLNQLNDVNAKIVDEHSFSEILIANDITFIGDGAEKCKVVLQHPNASFVIDNFNSAAHMSTLAHQAFTQARFEDVAYFEPFYLKDFVLTTPKKK